MSVLPSRYDLLNARLERFSRALPGVETRDIRSVHRTRVASRRLRELLPVLQLDGEAARKLTHQLRKVTRKLGSVREADVLLLLIEELHESGRFHEPALRLVRESIRGTRDDARQKMPGKSAVGSFRRIVRKLDRAARKLEGKETTQSRRAWRWALDARVSRRAHALESAIDEAGSVYLPERLHRTRIALKKLRYGLELDAEARGGKVTADLRLLKRMQELLGRLHDLQVLIDRVRRVQASLAPPNLTAWRNLDALVTALEQSCRRLHARYVGERETLLDLCDRLTRRTTPASRTTQRGRRAAS
jgi:CHAD domain-containing protein